jgi:hexulose-6-phosphate isomerase
MKDQEIERRSFLKYAATATIATGFLSHSEPTQAGRTDARLRKALQFGMLPKSLSDSDKFKLARKCGFEGIEGSPMNDLDAAKRLGDLARDAGTPIHSIVFGGWHAPFSSGDPKVIEKGLAGMKTALRSAKALGADTVLLVPAVLNEEVGYGQAYERSQRHIRKLLPLAEELKIVIAVENVWNKFLLSPLEFARYVDEFESPWLKAYFDVGNVIIYGYAQDWIRTLGKRIVKIHLKDFKRQGYQWKNLLEGDVNWKQVRLALGEIGYDGFLTPELGGGDQAYLTDLSGRIDKIIDMT